LEKIGVPTVYLTTSQFNDNAHLSAEDNGVPNMRIIGVPAELFYRERISRERARPMAEQVFPQMMASLTHPITREESQPKSGSNKTATITFTADNMVAAIEDFNQAFLDNQWSDGLPILPPTPERVQWMLSGTRRAPDEVLGAISPRNGIATIEKIAINAVMAGARPEYLPVIIAAVEGLADPGFDELHFATSTGSFNLVIGVSGAITEEIGMNAGLGMFSYGNRANSAIGRAVRMSLINFGHTWPAANDMALLGRPSAHTFLTFAENQAMSPWPAYRVSQGFAEDDSTVTLTVTGGYASGVASNIYGGGAVALVPPERILEQIARDMSRRRGGISARNATGVILSGNDKAIRSSYLKFFIIMNPEVAQELNGRLGYSRESLQEKLFEMAGVPYEELSEQDIAAVQRAVDIGYIPAKYREQVRQQLQPGGRVPMLSSPQDMHIMVAGGIPGYTMMVSYFRDGVYKPVAHITKKINGAVLTDGGR
jgi:hypothetical protein